MERAKLFLLLVAISAFFCATGCATILNDDPELIIVSTNPTAAKVFLDNNEVGTSPLTVKMSIDQSHIIRVEKEGYETKSETIVRRIGWGWVILDIICGIIPVVVDLITSKWYELNVPRSELRIDLRPVR